MWDKLTSLKLSTAATEFCLLGTLKCIVRIENKKVFEWYE